MSLSTSTIEEELPAEFLGQADCKDDLAEYLDGFPADDIVLLGGSRAEGHATSRSDIDLFHISESDKLFYKADFPGIAAEAENVSIVSSQLKSGSSIQLHSYRKSYVERIVARLASGVTANLDDMSTAGFLRTPLLTNEDLLLLHEIRIGLPLKNSQGFRPIQNMVANGGLAKILMHRNLLHYYSLLNSALAQHKLANCSAAAWMLKESVVYLAKFVLSIIGYTNHRDKWLVSALSANGEAIGCELSKNLTALIWITPSSAVGDVLDSIYKVEASAVGLMREKCPDSITSIEFLSITFGRSR